MDPDLLYERRLADSMRPVRKTIRLLENRKLRLGNAEFSASSKNMRCQVSAKTLSRSESSNRNSDNPPPKFSESRVLAVVPGNDIRMVSVGTAINLNRDFLRDVGKIHYVPVNGKVVDQRLDSHLLESSSYDNFEIGGLHSSLLATRRVSIPSISSFGKGPHLIALSPKPLLDSWDRALEPTGDFSGTVAFLIESIHFQGRDWKPFHSFPPTVSIRHSAEKCNVQGRFVRLLENRKLHYRTNFQDIPISIENRKGSIRRGEDSDGSPWETKMSIPYGYIPGTEGADGDAVDTFVGPCEDAAYAYVVHCNDPESGDFDEDKVMLGFESADSAKRVFLQHYDDPKFFGGMDSIPMWKFRKMVWTKKHTAGPMRESWGFSSKSLIHEPTGHGGASHIFTSAREHGTQGMKWGARQAIEKAGAVYKGSQEHPAGGLLHYFNDPKTGSTLALRDHQITSPKDVTAHMEKSRAKKGW